MPSLDTLPLAAAAGLFVAAAIAVVASGVLMTRLADRLADITGLGEAVTGAALLGAATSLSGTVVSVTASLDGNASLAFANGVGGIAAQTAFLAVADIVWRRANLEHASADLAIVFQAALLALMLSLPLVALAGPEITLFGLHPVSYLLVGLYIFGLKATSGIRARPMWTPVATLDTRADVPEEDGTDAGRDLPGMLLRFAILGAVLALAGWTIARTGGRISEAAGISETAVGALLTAVVTSLPELVTTLAAVQRGAAQLAVGGIIGGNIFDMLFLTLSDAAWQEGSLYHAITTPDLLWIATGMAMTAVLLLGLIARERQGPANIGIESVALLGIYAGAVAIQLANG